MGMVVRTNAMAINANRQLGMNNSAVGKSLEKLSSGFRINRAGDDASGLAISEKMKAQIKGLEQASSNSQDGISLIQTAEGALTETHNMLNRMVELATKSANGTIQNEVDRENIQNEVNALISEIDRIGNSTNFNGINLLDGTMGSASSGSSAAPATIVVGTNFSANQSPTITANSAKAASVTTAAFVTKSTGALTAGQTDVGITFKDELGVNQTVTVNLGAIATNDNVAEKLANAIAADSKLSAAFDVTVNDDEGLTFVAKDGSDATLISYTLGSGGSGIGSGAAVSQVAETKINTTLDIGSGNSITAGDMISIGGKVYEFVANDGDETKREGATAIVIGTDNDGTMTNLNAALKKDGLKIEATTANQIYKISELESSDTSATGQTGSLTLQVGDTSAAYNKVQVTVKDMRSTALGVGAIDVSDQKKAGDQIQVIKNAINTVSKTRGDLGALQNRLEYTINNLDVSAENMTAANSRIRDTDMAKEMMTYTKMNVLVQSAQAMLAQANQQPQSILQLLQ